ncbi:MAG: hypothetical protein AAF518_11185 [Spirochaetota bacterium]
MTALKKVVIVACVFFFSSPLLAKGTSLTNLPKPWTSASINISFSFGKNNDRKIRGASYGSKRIFRFGCEIRKGVSTPFIAWNLKTTEFPTLYLPKDKEVTLSKPWSMNIGSFTTDGILNLKGPEVKSFMQLLTETKGKYFKVKHYDLSSNAKTKKIRFRNVEKAYKLVAAACKW